MISPAGVGGDTWEQNLESTDTTYDWSVGPSLTFHDSDWKCDVDRRSSKCSEATRRERGYAWRAKDKSVGACL